MTEREKMIGKIYREAERLRESCHDTYAPLCWWGQGQKDVPDLGRNDYGSWEHGPNGFRAFTDYGIGRNGLDTETELKNLGYDLRVGENGEKMICFHEPRIVRAGISRFKIRVGAMNLDLEWIIAGTATGFLCREQAQQVIDAQFKRY